LKVFDKKVAASQLLPFRLV